MNNDEIKALLRELKERSDESGEVKSQTVKICFGEEEPEKERPKKRKSRKRFFRKQEEAPAGEEAELSFEEETELPDGEEAKLPAKKEEEKSAKEEAKTPAGEPAEALLPAGEEAEEAPEEEPKEEPEIKPETPEEPESEAGTGKKKAKEKPVPRRRRLPGERSGFSGIKTAVSDFFAGLKAKGIAGKELIMIGTVAVLAVLIVILVISSLSGGESQSAANVTADEGLTVTVRQEPESWCTGGLVTLGIRARGEVQSVTVNGTVYAPENAKRAEISLEADSPLLELTVVDQEGTLNGSVELTMVDTQAPQVSVSQENGTVTMTASDDKSGVTAIYYGTTVGLGDVPFYQRYTGSFPYQEGKTYYYYAVDNAGNSSVPLSTSMEAATALAFDQEQISLFPGESRRLSLTASPSGGYFNNLTWEVSDPSVIRLEEDGTVTALKEGEARVQAAADGLEPAVCQVQVDSERQITISALGDCTLGSDAYFNTTTSFDAFWQTYGDSYFFENVRSILSEDDITFANFEGTLTTLDTRENKQYAFKGDPSYTDILLDGSIDSVTLANNHSSDYGAQSLTDTQQYLEEAGIDYCTGDKIIVKEANGVKVGLIGIYVLDEGMGKEDQVRETIASAKEQGAQVVVVAFHWGTEKSESPDETQISLAHTAIDCGADLVVGHHPHVLQGIELYQGKYIAYSLANFCFGGNNAPSDMDTMIFQQTFTVTAEGVQGEGEVNLIPCSVSSQAGWNDYRPTPASGEEADRIMEKINARSAQFGQSFEAGN